MYASRLISANERHLNNTRGPVWPASIYMYTSIVLAHRALDPIRRPLGRSSPLSISFDISAMPPLLQYCLLCSAVEAICPCFVAHRPARASPDCSRESPRAKSGRTRSISTGAGRQDSLAVMYTGKQRKSTPRLRLRGASVGLFAGQIPAPSRTLALGAGSGSERLITSNNTAARNPSVLRQPRYGGIECPSLRARTKVGSLTGLRRIVAPPARRMHHE